MALAKSRTPFDISGYVFIGLIGLVILGFWPSYFAKFFNGTANFTFYFHFHAIALSLWILTLIAQPILIRKKKLAIHRFIGRLTYLLFPLICISIILLAHSRITGNERDLGLRLIVPFKDLVIIGTAYGIAIRYRRTVAIHARGMIATGIVVIEPALSRLLINVSHNLALGYLMTVLVVYSLLVALIIKERKQKQGRWVFPLILGLYMIAHSIILLQVRIGPWERFAKWFAALPLT